METDSLNDGIRESSYFRSPTFFAGIVLWLAVLGALAGVWYQQRLKQPPAGPSIVAEQPAESDGAPPKTIIIKTNKDGSLAIDESGKPASASPWDKDGIADFEFIDTEGKTMTKADLLGKPWIVCFVFTHCAATCPTVTNSMRELQDRLKDYDFRLVTLTVDPERDTPEVLKGYGESRGADFSKWMFLGGEQRAIYKLIQGSFKMPVQETLGKDRRPGFEFIHSNNIMLVDAEGVVQGKFDATKGEAMSVLRREIQKRTKRLTPRPRSGARDDAEDPDAAAIVPNWVATLPMINAGLNGLATVLLLTGFVLIKRGRREAHARVMVSAFGTSIVFLACYLTYHFALHHYTGESGKKFGGVGVIRPIYFVILISHVLLAMTVPVLASMTIYRAWRQNWEGHRRLARVTFPIWVYVSVTGVIIYALLYHWPVAVVV